MNICSSRKQTEGFRVRKAPEIIWFNPSRLTCVRSEPQWSRQLAKVTQPVSGEPGWSWASSLSAAVQKAELSLGPWGD